MVTVNYVNSSSMASHLWLTDSYNGMACCGFESLTHTLTALAGREGTVGSVYCMCIIESFRHAWPLNWHWQANWKSVTASLLQLLISMNVYMYVCTVCTHTCTWESRFLVCGTEKFLCILCEYIIVSVCPYVPIVPSLLALYLCVWGERRNVGNIVL